MFKKLGATYLCGSLEKCPTTGKPHIQFVFHLPKPGKRATAVFKLDKGASYTMGNADNYYAEHGYEYSAKPETHIDGPWKFGTRPMKMNSKVDWDKVWDNAKTGNIDDIPASIRIRYYGNIKRIEKDHMRVNG